MILSTHVSGIASNVVSFSGVVINFYNNESNKIYLSAKVYTFLIAALVSDNFSAQDIHICLEKIG